MHLLNCSLLFSSTPAMFGGVQNIAPALRRMHLMWPAQGQADFKRPSVRSPNYKDFHEH